MTTGVTTVDFLVSSIRKSYVAANESIVHSQQPDAQAGEGAQFTINNVSGKPPCTIPLSKLQSPLRYYLRELRFELPCYTLSGTRLLKGQPRGGILYLFTPTRWQRMYHRCCIYRLTIEIGIDYARANFRPATEDEAAHQVMKPATAKTAWRFKLTEEQLQQLLALSETVAKPIYWHMPLLRFWRWLRGGDSKQN